MKISSPSLSYDQISALSSITSFINGGARSVTLTGPAGSGKSYLVKELAKLSSLAICATTNQAARLIDGVTVHSLLSITPKRDYKTGTEIFTINKKVKPLPPQLILIDEASMVSSDLFKLLMKTKHRFIFVGDRCQLPPVNEDISKVFTHGKQITLTQIHRQAADSPIIQQSIRLRHQQEIIPVNDVIITRRNEWLHDFDKKLDLCVSFTNKASIKWNHVIDPRLIGPWSSLITNDTIVYKDESGKDSIVIGSSQVAIFDMHEATFKGVKGWAVELEGIGEKFMPDNIDDAKAALREIAALCAKKKASWRQYFEMKDHFVDLRYPYSMTVHKSQGQTVRNIYVDMADILISKRRDPSIYWKLAYVAITRASEKVIIKVK